MKVLIHLCYIDTVCVKVKVPREVTRGAGRLNACRCLCIVSVVVCVRGRVLFVRLPPSVMLPVLASMPCKGQWLLR